MKKLNNSYFDIILVAIITALVLSSCMAGGTAGTGLGYGTASGRRSADNIMYANVTGVVTDSRGKAAAAIKITARSNKTEESAQTDAVGSFGILLVAAPGEEVHFTFTDRTGKKWSGKFSSWNLRDGDQLSVKLSSDGHAKIEMFY